MFYRDAAAEIHLTARDISPLSLRPILTAAFLYLAATLLFFYPCIPSISHSLIGPPEDNLFFIWSLWHGTEALRQDPAGFMRTQFIFYPEGISLYFCNYYYYGVALAFFLKTFLSLPLVYNLLVLHTFVLAGLGAFLLVHYITRDLRAALLGGFIFAFNPSHFAHSLHHVTIASIQFIPLFVLFFIKAAREGKKSFIFLASFFMSLNALCDWNYLVFDLLFILLSAAYLFFRNTRNAGEILKRILPIPAFSLILLSPLIVPMILAGLKQPFLGDLSGHDIYVADFFGFFIPDPYHWAYSASGWIRGINDAMTGNNWEKTVYLGLANIVLILAAARWTWKECGKYYLGLGAFMVLAMGVTPHFLGRSLPFPLPYHLIQEIPFLTQARNPSRIIVYAYLFLAILAAFSVKKISSSLRPGSFSKIIFPVIFLAVFFDFYSVSTAMTPVVLPPGYAAIQNDKDKNFGILELPWDGARYMMYQTIHGIPCVQGYMGRRVERTLSSRLTYDFKRLARQKEMLIEARVKYIVLHKRKMVPDPSANREIAYRVVMSRAADAYSKTYEKIFEDPDCAVYKVY